MHRCWLEAIAPLTIDELTPLSEEESLHITRVLRMKVSEKVQLIAADRLYAGELADVNENAVTVRVLAELPPPECPVRITLIQGLPKLDKLELIIQKATELGAWDIVPVEMERSVVRLDAKEDKKRERWNRIALEAAKQSGRAHVPDIRSACRWPQAITTLQREAYDAIFVAWEEENTLRLSEAVQQLLAKKLQPCSIALVIGSEGGITPKEIDQWKAIGAQCVTLGKRILRTETAGLCALAVTMSVLGEL